MGANLEIRKTALNMVVNTSQFFATFDEFTEAININLLGWPFGLVLTLVGTSTK